jgi:putative ABC transport system permease protein
VKFLPLIWCGLWRKPARALLTFLSIVVAFVLFGLLQGVNSAFDRLIASQRLDLLYLNPRFGDSLPYSYKAQVQRLKGVARVTELHYMGTIYQEPANGIALIFTDPAGWLALRPDEWHVPQPQVDAITQTRTGILVSEGLAKRFGWKRGDRVSFIGSIARKDGSRDWPFDVVGLMAGGDESSRIVLANYAYLDAARALDAGVVSRFLVKVDDGAQAARVSREVDSLFMSSPAPTRTQSERALIRSVTSTLGDLAFFTRSILSAVFFALLFLTLNATMESVRERTAELATLKTLGYTDDRVLALVIAESVVQFGVAAIIGLTVAVAFFPIAARIFRVGELPLSVLAIGVALALLAAVISAGVPAWRARALGIVQGLAVR